MPNRIVHHADALIWLKENSLTGCSVVTSLPDFSEFSRFTLQEWKDWFVAAAQAVLEACPPEGVAMFYQTDIKHEGTWVDKAFLVQKAAETVGTHLLFHKVVCKAPPGNATFGRPGYSHLLCFSRTVRAAVALSVPDVLPEAGEVTWTRGMGVQACVLACHFIQSQTSTRTVVDPFCGHGTVLAVANELGLDAVGVELGGKRAERARILRAPGLKLAERGTLAF